MIDLPNKPLLRVDEVADFFNRSKSTVYMWIDHKRIEVKRTPAGSIVGVYRDSVLQWADRLKESESVN